MYFQEINTFDEKTWWAIAIGMLLSAAGVCAVLVFLDIVSLNVFVGTLALAIFAAIYASAKYLPAEDDTVDNIRQ